MYRFLTKDTVVRERVQATAESAGDIDTPFVELTICPTYDAGYKGDTLNAYGMDKEEYRYKAIYSPGNNTHDIDLVSIYKSVTHDIEEMLVSIKVYTTNEKTGQRSFDIKFDQPNFMEHIDITTKYHPYLGRCFSIHLKDHVLKLGINAVTIVARIDVLVYFGHPGQFMNPNTKSKVYQCLSNHIR